MPSDITGTEIIVEEKTGQREFKFVKGPVFANIVLADEINRTPPKTQSALLEAMQEYKVTAGGSNFDIEKPFFVLATQNPIEQEGTYPLPEAQLDRFMLSLWLDYPSFEDEIKIVKNTTSVYNPILNKILNKKEIVEFQGLVRKVPVSDYLIDYVVKLVSATRPSGENKIDFVNKWVRWGAGPRAAQFLIIGAKVKALMKNKATPDKVDVMI